MASNFGEAPRAAGGLHLARALPASLKRSYREPVRMGSAGTLPPDSSCITTDDSSDASAMAAQTRSAALSGHPGLVQIFPRRPDHTPACWPLPGESLIGRSRECAVALQDPRVSRKHASVALSPAGALVRDEGSRRGTMVQGVPAVGQGIAAAFGDVIRAGDTLLMLVRDIAAYRSVPRRIPAAALGMRNDILAGPSYAESLDRAARVGDLDQPVLILGETGSGKESVARILHAARQSPGPFVTLNIAAIAPTLFEAELFGHEKGAFTGALMPRKGAFVEANGGVLFLDEVADLSVDLQVKLLRVIDTQRVRPVGGSKDISVSVRVVAATSRNVREACASGAFRADLYYRLAGVVIPVPPLRDRRDEVLLLAQAMIAADGFSIELTADAAEVLAVAGWQGNVRNLRRVMTHAIASTRQESRTRILVRDLPELAPLGDAPADEGKMTAQRVRLALKKADGVAGRAAEILGVSRSTFYNICKRLGVEANALRK